MKKLLILLFLFNAAFGQRVNSVKVTTPITNTGSATYPVIGIDVSKLPVATITPTTINSLAPLVTVQTGNNWTLSLPGGIDASFIKSGKIDTARLPAVSITLLTEIPAGLVNGVNKVYALTGKPLSNIQLFLNGNRTNDFTIVGQTITMTNPPQLGDDLLADYFK